ncbi:MAG: universal stress protein [Deltaproteobacteria bacterium]|nr:universal stress protein [Deltaproteobacteria bacterium]MBW1960786.1 universal stress protein [Deltaproteobacteria bacterium]MBW2153501.1 universal stress protein [Deltaproteobacteria bacterium]
MKIMIGYDGSEESKRALDLAIKHAKAFKGMVFIVTAMKQDPELELKDIERAEQNLREAELHCKKEKVPLEKHLVVNDMEPGETLVRFTENNDIDEAVIGIRKTSKVGKFLFGSTAQYMVLESPCPVATVK